MSELIITAGNFEHVARAAYHNPSCVDISELSEDLSRFRYLRRLFKRYADKKELKHRLILNHIIILYNVIQPAPLCTRLLLFRLNEYMSQVKPFLVLLNYWSEGKVNGVPNINYGSDIPLDQEIVKVLRAEFNGKQAS